MREPIILLEADTDRKAWLEARKSGLTATDFAKIMGLSNWGTPTSVYLDKISPVGDEVDRIQFDVGNALAPVVAKRFNKAHPDCQVIRSEQLAAHPDHPWFMATPDFWIVRDGDTSDPGLLEAKSSDSFAADAMGWNGTDAPDEVVIQWNAQAHVFDVTWGYVAVIIGNHTYHEWPMVRDDELISMMVATGYDFHHNNVLAQVPPPLGDTKADADLVKLLHPAGTVDDEVPDLTDALVEIPGYDPMPGVDALRMLDNVRDDLDVLDHQKTLIENHLKALIGDHKGAMFGDRKVLWGVTTSLVIDMDKAKAEDPALVLAYTQAEETAAASKDRLAAKYGSRVPTSRTFRPGKPKK